MRAYSPDRADVVWIELSPHSGHEQRGRGALVLSPKAYNAKTGLAIFCPITSQVKGYPFEVRIPDDLPVEGVVLADQVKSLDWRARRAKLLARLPEPLLREVFAKLQVLLEP